MFEAIFQEIKNEFKSGGMVMRLIIINAVVFVAINLLWVALFLGGGQEFAKVSIDGFINWVALSSSWKLILTRPWTIITHMFLHTGFMHVLFNLLFLFWFGRILKDLAGNHRILPIYILGGLGGFLAFVLAANLLPEHISGQFGMGALGASAAVTAIILAAATFAPNYSIYLILLGPVKMKYIAGVIILLSIFGLRGENSGGEFAHLGGALVGWLYVYQLRRGSDWAVPFNNMTKVITGFFAGEKKPRQSRSTTQQRPTRNNKKAAKSGIIQNNLLSDEQKVDAILDKINRSGYDSLTEVEKEFLFKASKK